MYWLRTSNYTPYWEILNKVRPRVNPLTTVVTYFVPEIYLKKKIRSERVKRAVEGEITIVTQKSEEIKKKETIKKIFR